MEHSKDTFAFYGHAKSYWKDVPATVDGMLDGLSQISSTDIGGSLRFLKPFIKGDRATTKSRRALDCGAGIGRITKKLLLPLFDVVDMVELNQAFLDEARNFIGSESSRVENFTCSGLQDYSPEPAYYDVIWCQWVLGHLTDDDLVAFFQRCKAGLLENGLVIIKENISRQDEPELDMKDSSYTRCRRHYVELIERAGLTVVKEEVQKSFPKDLYEVRMFALQ